MSTGTRHSDRWRPAPFPSTTCTWCPIDTMSSLSAAICRRATLPNPRSIGSFLMRLGEAAAKRERRQNRSVALVRVEVWKIEFSGPGGACRSRFPLAVRQESVDRATCFAPLLLRDDLRDRARGFHTSSPRDGTLLPAAALNWRRAPARLRSERDRLCS